MPMKEQQRIESQILCRSQNLLLDGEGREKALHMLCAEGSGVPASDMTLIFSHPVSVDLESLWGVVAQLDFLFQPGIFILP
jgi:hypothetical protein